MTSVDKFDKLMGNAPVIGASRDKMIDECKSKSSAAYVKCTIAATKLGEYNACAGK